MKQIGKCVLALYRDKTNIKQNNLHKWSNGILVSGSAPYFYIHEGRFSSHDVIIISKVDKERCHNLGNG